ncbi:hypothetical protein ACFL15_02455 [Patescibacteria group bacterium]
MRGKGKVIVKTCSGAIYTIKETGMGNLKIISRKPDILPFSLCCVIGSGEIIMGSERLDACIKEERITSEELVEKKHMFIMPIDINLDLIPKDAHSLNAMFYAKKGRGWWKTSPIVSIEYEEE